MPVDFSVINNRSVVGVGKVFENGHYLKSPFLVPINDILATNLKALIYQEQATVFAEIETLNGITFQKEGSEYFNQSSIHKSVHYDQNKLAIWLDFRDQQNEGTDKPRVTIPVTLYVTPGKGEAEAQIARSQAYIRGLINLLTVVPSQFFIVGWPANVATGKINYQPEVKIQFKFDSTPDGQGNEGNAQRPIGVLNFDIILTPKANNIP